MKNSIKKTIFSLLALMIFAFHSQAQDKKGYIGISLGPSSPRGDFSNKDYNSPSAGWANNGAMFDISFAYKLGEGYFGIIGLLRGQSNQTDAQVIADQIAIRFPRENLRVESEGWGMRELMVGGFLSRPISKKISHDSRVMIGYLSVDSPEKTYTAAVPGSTAWVKQNSASAGSFAFLLGVGLTFDIGNKLFLLTNFDYLASNPKFSDIEVIDNYGGRKTDSLSQNIETFNFSVGIALKL